MIAYFLIFFIDRFIDKYFYNERTRVSNVKNFFKKLYSDVINDLQEVKEVKPLIL